VHFIQHFVLNFSYFKKLLQVENIAMHYYTKMIVE